MVQKNTEPTEQPVPNKVLLRKRQILKAASEAFRYRGFHKTGMRDIAAAMSMTVGSLYYYFRTKQELLSFCQEDTLLRLDALMDWVKLQELSAPQSLYLIIVGHVSCLNELTVGSIAHLEVEGLSEENTSEILRKRDRYERAIRNEISRGILDKQFREVDPKVASLSILGAANWTVKWFRTEGEQSARAIGATQALMMVQGLLASQVEFSAPELQVPAFEVSAFESSSISTDTYKQ